MKSESQEVEAIDAKKPRRKLTPEQRIQEREAEIQRIKAKQQENVRDLMEDALNILRDAQAKADSWGMTVEGGLIAAAIKALEPSA